MTETIFQHVSVSKVSCTSFIDRSFLPMVPLTLPMVPFHWLPILLRVLWSPMIPMAKLSKIQRFINGTIGGIPNVAHIITVRCNFPGLVIERTQRPRIPWSHRDRGYKLRNSREIVLAGLMCGAVTFVFPPQCRVSAGLVILCKYTLVEFTIIKSRALTLSRSP